MGEHDAAIDVAADIAHLDPAIVRAVVQVESSGNQWAWNPEPRYRWFWHVKNHAPFRAVTPSEVRSKTPPADFPALRGDPDQEWWAQQASWGLMQIMGAVARELDCRVPYLTELLDPTLNLFYGCQHLAALQAWAGGDQARMFGAYNAGKGGWHSDAGRRYAAKVQLTMSQLA